MTNIRRLPTPLEMIKHLDIYVRGQDAAKRALSKAVYFHYINLALPPDPSVRPSPEHTILVGPTGSGKTLLVKSLADLLGVPVLFVNAASLTSEGYVGDSVGDTLVRYARLCGGHEGKMTRGIIFLDEIDKIRANNDHHADIRGTMVQQELLTILDGNRVVRSAKGNSEENYSIDTSKILFIGCGAFSGIEKIVSNRTSGLGFRSVAPSASGRKAISADISSQDIISYGFLPEFTGRFPNVITLQKLSEEELCEILMNTEQSPITPYKRLFSLHDVDLTFTTEALQEVAAKAISAEQGARGLRHSIAESLASVAWRIGDLRDERIVGITVEAGVISGEATPTLERGNRDGSSTVRQLRDVVFGCMDENAEPPESSHDANSLNQERSSSQEPTRITTISDTEGWSDEQVRHRYDYVKVLIKYHLTEGSARKWWDAFEAENPERPKIVLRLAEELAVRGASVWEFFMAYVWSDTDNIQANLDCLDYRRARRDWAVSTTALYDAGGLQGYGATIHEARRLLNYDEGTLAAQLVWRCVEHNCGNDGEALVGIALKLCSHGVGNLDTYYEWVTRCGEVYPRAVVAFVGYLRGRGAVRTAEEGFNAEALPYWGDLPVPQFSGAMSDFMQRLTFLREIAEGIVWDRLDEIFGSEVISEGDAEIVRERGLKSAFEASPLRVRHVRGIRSSADWREEVTRWTEAVSHYPSDRASIFSKGWVEGIIAEISPCLCQDTSWLAGDAYPDFVAQISSITNHNTPDHEIAALLMYYTGKQLRERWGEFIRHLSSELSFISEAWSEFERGERKVREYELPHSAIAERFFRANDG